MLKGDPVSADSQLNDLQSEVRCLLSYEGMKGLEEHITMRGNSKPVVLKARRVLYALKEQVERELDRLKKHRFTCLCPAE